MAIKLKTDRRKWSLGTAIIAFASMAISAASADDLNTLREALAYLHGQYGLSPAQVAETITSGTSPGRRLVRWEQQSLNVAILGTVGAPTALLGNMAETLRAEASTVKIAAAVCVENFSVSNDQRVLPLHGGDDCLAAKPDILIVFDASSMGSNAVIEGLSHAWKPPNQTLDRFWDGAAKLGQNSEGISSCSSHTEAKPDDGRITAAIAYILVGDTSQSSMDKLGECMEIGQHVTLGIMPIKTEGHYVFAPRLLQVIYAPMLSVGMSRSDVEQILEGTAR